MRNGGLPWRGTKVSHSETEYMFVPKWKSEVIGRRDKEDKDFKYLRSTVQSNGECGNVKRNVCRQAVYIYNQYIPYLTRSRETT